MRTADLAAVAFVQRECFPPPLLEGEAIYAVRLANCPDTSWVIDDEYGVCAYLVGYRSTLGKIAALGGAFAHVAEADCLYLHDLSVTKRARGQGLPARLLEHAADHARARRLASLALTAVLDTPDYWRRHGFETFTELDLHESATLAAYGVPALYMTRAVSPSRMAAPLQS